MLELGVFFATVARIWRNWNLQPWRTETFKFSTDPELEAKIRDVVGLYVNPPGRRGVRKREVPGPAPRPDRASTQPRRPSGLTERDRQEFVYAASVSGVDA